MKSHTCSIEKKFARRRAVAWSTACSRNISHSASSLGGDTTDSRTLLHSSRKAENLRTFPLKRGQGAAAAPAGAAGLARRAAVLTLWNNRGPTLSQNCGSFRSSAGISPPPPDFSVTLGICRPVPCSPSPEPMPVMSSQRYKIPSLPPDKPGPAMSCRRPSPLKNWPRLPARDPSYDCPSASRSCGSRLV